MEAVSTAELIELTMQGNELLDYQFQYWLSASIAVVVATFIGGVHLTTAMRLVMMVLYLLASAFFCLKYLAVAYWLVQFRELAGEQQILETPLASYIFYVRAIIFLSGIVATLWFLQTARRGENT